MDKLTKIINGKEVELTKKEVKALKDSWKRSEEAQVELEKTAYVQARIASYPPIGEQLDMLFKAMESGEIPKAAEWFNTIKGVKAANPKPGA